MTLFEFRFGTTLEANQILSWGAKISKKNIHKPNILVFQSLTTQNLVLNDEIKYFDLNNNQIFGGYVQKISNNYGIQTVEVGDYSVKFSQIRISEVYLNSSPETIIESIISNYTNLTFSSSVSTGLSIQKIVFKDEWILNAISKLLELFNGVYGIDFSKNFLLKIAESDTCSQSISYGVDVLKDYWKTDIQKKAESVIVLGAVISPRTTETISGTGTVFYTTYKPENVEIAGLKQKTSDIVGDFVVDVQEKKITFDSIQTNPTISYTYKSQIRVEIGTGKTVILEKKYIESKSEARKLAIEYQNKFYDGSKSAKWEKNSSDIGDFFVGDKIFVTDDENEKTGYYLITSVVLELPSKIIIGVGESEEDLFDWQKETVERIKQLEKKNVDADYITKYNFLKQSLKISAKVDLTKLYAVIDDGVVLWASDTPLASDGDLISDDGFFESWNTYDTAVWTNPQPTGATIVNGELQLQSTNLVVVEVLSNNTFTYAILKIRAKFTDVAENILNGVIGFFEATSLYDYVKFDVSNGLLYADTRVNDVGNFEVIGTVDTDYHDFEIQWSVGNAKFFVDGILKATHTTHVPNKALQIYFKSWAKTALTSNMMIDWIQIGTYAIAFDDGSIPSTQFFNYLG